MLKIQVKNPRQSTQQNAVWVVERLFSIGCDPDDDLILIDDSVSPGHASLITLDNRLYLKDNHSAKGCFVNDKKINKKEVTPGDVMRVGNVEIVVMDPRDSLNQDALTVEQLDNFWSLVADGSFLTGQEFYLQKSPSIIGRGSQCDIVLPGTHLSRQHAEIRVQGNLLHIRDLASSNGTYINDNRVTEGIARPGDQIKFDNYSFRVTGPVADKNKTQLRIPQAKPSKQFSHSDSTNTDRHWQSKPTSPGNRIVEEEAQGIGRKFVTFFILIAMLGTLAYLVYPMLAS
jgi:pSer/pThr/pTyr-binding forkhead associated (FHA) protein